MICECGHVIECHENRKYCERVCDSSGMINCGGFREKQK